MKLKKAFEILIFCDEIRNAFRDDGKIKTNQYYITNAYADLYEVIDLENNEPFPKIQNC